MTQDKTDRRTAARVLAMQSLYQLDVQGDDLLEQLPLGFLRESGQDDYVRKMAFQWIKGTWENLSHCDELISGAIIRWQMSRLSPVDKSILRLSVYHLSFCPDIPPKVVINEAIELGKKFSSEKSSGFINGVLDAVLKKL
ncbi:MAG: transcription antitermination factor NusB [Phycisphaerae bacterium]|nr:transcription antitermination factor NusB [Phycisphaerae bacterium]